MNKVLTILGSLCVVGTMVLNASVHKLDLSHSNVGFSIKHLMISNVKGNFKTYEAAIDFDYKTKSFNTFNATVDIASVNTQNEKRDKHLRSEDFFQANMYPKMTFKMAEYKKMSDNHGVMTGELKIKNIKKVIQFDVEDLGVIKDFKGNNRVGFTLVSKINRADFGLTWNKALEFGGFAVGEKVKITIDVEAIEK